jgi:hypothetical protein
VTASYGEILETIGAPTSPFAPQRGALSSLFRWYSDEDRLCVVAGDPTMGPLTSDIGFAHALGHLGDRDLIVVFPTAGADAVADRLPFLEISSTCWAMSEAGLSRVQPRRPADVIAAYAGMRGGSHDVSVATVWIEPLLNSLASRPGLVEDDRKSYRTWQYKGRQVLTLRMASATEAELVAGVNYSDPRPDVDPPVVLRLSAAITSGELADVTDAIDRACKGRDSGADQANAEHLLQERLRTEWKPLGLRSTPLREVPVRRPIGYGYIDLVGAGQDGRIHVIETKLGPFDRLIVQGLDYWIWANANRSALCDLLALPPDAGVAIDYVVAEKEPGHGVIGSYTSGQAETLQGAIRWRFTTVRNWTGAGPPEVTRLALRTMPSGSKGRPAPRKARPRWSVRLAHHLAERATADGVTLEGGVFWPNTADGLEPAAVIAHEQLAADGLAHHMLGHVRSSQAFALNLFAPLDADARIDIAKTLGVDAIAVAEPRFEWSDPDDELRERTHASPHATQVDVRLDCQTKSGKTIVCLIEVKLSEPDFNPCSAWLSNRNDRLDVCATDGPFGGDVQACFQLRNHDRDHRRTYDAALGPIPVAGGASQGCWFRFGGNQIMRNAALARSLVTRGVADRAVVALCAPKAHHAIWRRWRETTSLLHLDSVTFAELPADVVAAQHTNPASITERYLLALVGD